MDYKGWSLYLTLAFVCIATSGVFGTHHLPINEHFDASFNDFLSKSQYQGAAAGVMHQGKLIYAQGYGKMSNDHKITPETLFPMSSFSKSLTAVSVLKLAEENKLRLTDKVFGKHGILSHLSPWSAHPTDSRLFEITVDNLLRHAAGWNSNKPPLFDPLLNSVYLTKGYRVPNITKIMKLTRKAELRDILKYVMSIPLHFQPGTQSIYSNIGYVILTRIIEKVQDSNYHTFVRKNILEPCGMWHTKAGLHVDEDEKQGTDKHMAALPTNALHIQPENASFGWHSNVFDIMRFLRCLDHSGDHHLLKESSIKLLLEKPGRITGDIESWMGAGFNVNKHGAIWQENDMKTDDMLIYHKALLRSVRSHHNTSHQEADAFVMLLVGRKNSRLFGKDFLKYLKDLPVGSPDYFNYDLADMRIGNTEEEGRIIKYRLSEHHISAYISAIREQDFKVEWVSAFELNRQAFFTVIAQLNPGQPRDAFYFQHGLDEKRLLHYKNVYSRKHAYLTLLQCYLSFPHANNQKYMALFNKQKEEPVDIKFGIRQYSQSYKLFSQVYHEKGYTPRVQSFVHINQEPMVCFILEKKPIKDYKEYMDISMKDLIINIRLNAKAGRTMTYMDSSNRYRKPRFSAIFRKDTTRQGIFKYNLDSKSLEEVIADQYLKGNYLPKFLIGYANKKGILQFAIYLDRNIPHNHKNLN